MPQHASGLAFVRRGIVQPVVRIVQRTCIAILPAIAATRLAAQDMEVPVAVQIPLFLKVISFDRHHAADQPLVFGIVFQSGYRASVEAKNEALLAIAAVAPAAPAVRPVAIDLDRESLPNALGGQRFSVVYVTPVRAISIGDIAAATSAARVTTFTGVPRFVALGLAVGVRLQGERPRLLINLPAARASGADFSAELLKLAQVTP